MASGAQFDDPYAVLGVAPTADAATVRAAYRLRALESHPDRTGGSTVRMAAVTGAYAMLSDPAHRAAWDRRAGPRAAAPTSPSPPGPNPAAPPPWTAPRPGPAADGTPFSAAREPRWRAGPDPERPQPAGSRGRQWAATLAAVTVVQLVLVLGGAVVLNAMTVALAVALVAEHRPRGECFWPLLDAQDACRWILRQIHAT